MRGRGYAKVTVLHPTHHVGLAILHLESPTTHHPAHIHSRCHTNTRVPLIISAVRSHPSTNLTRLAGRVVSPSTLSLDSETEPFR